MKSQAGVLLDALDRLARALADHKHDWTADERRAYERAVALCASRKATDSTGAKTRAVQMPCSAPRIQTAPI